MVKVYRFSINLDWHRNELKYFSTCLVFTRISLSRYRNHSNSAGSAAISLFGNGNWVDDGSRPPDWFVIKFNGIVTEIGMMIIRSALFSYSTWFGINDSRKFAGITSRSVYRDLTYTYIGSRYGLVKEYYRRYRV